MRGFGLTQKRNEKTYSFMHFPGMNTPRSAARAPYLFSNPNQHQGNPGPGFFHHRLASVSFCRNKFTQYVLFRLLSLTQHCLGKASICDCCRCLGIWMSFLTGQSLFPSKRLGAGGRSVGLSCLGFISLGAFSHYPLWLSSGGCRNQLSSCPLGKGFTPDLCRIVHCSASHISLANCLSFPQKKPLS